MKKFVLMLGLILCLGVVSAQDVYYKERFVESKYFPEKNVVLSRTVLVDYDNEDRYSTYDYRHGYSYRDMRDYFNRKHESVFYGDRLDGFRDYDRDRDFDEYWGVKRSWDYDRYDDRGYDYYRHSKYERDRHFDSGLRASYYEYVPHLREYEKRECYLTAPSDKLFYVKC